MKIKYSLPLVLLSACGAPKIAVMDPIAAVKGTLQYQTEIKNRLPELPQTQAKVDLLQLEIQKMEVAKSDPKAIATKKAEIQKLSQDFQAKFQQVENTFLNSLVQSSLPNLEQFLKEKKVDLLLSPNQLIFASNKVPNLTNEATTYLSAHLPAVKSTADKTSSTAEDLLQGTKQVAKEEEKKPTTGAK